MVKYLVSHNLLHSFFFVNIGAEKVNDLCRKYDRLIVTIILRILLKK